MIVRIDRRVAAERTDVSSQPIFQSVTASFHNWKLLDFVNMDLLQLLHMLMASWYW